MAGLPIPYEEQPVSLPSALRFREDDDGARFPLPYQRNVSAPEKPTANPTRGPRSGTFAPKHMATLLDLPLREGPVDVTSKRLSDDRAALPSPMLATS